MPRLVDADRRRGKLADAAACAIARSGIDGASLREVAAEAGWTTGALVHYFANKRELLAFTLRASLNSRCARRSDHAALTPDRALRTMLVDALPTTEEMTLHWVVALAFAGQAGSDPGLALIQRNAYLKFRATVIALIEICRPDLESDQEAERLLALVNGIALQSLFDPVLWTESRQLSALDAGRGHR